MTVGTRKRLDRGDRTQENRRGENQVEITVRLTEQDSSALAALRMFAGVLGRLRHGLDSSGRPWLCAGAKERSEERA